jgi:hypothetical protein
MVIMGIQRSILESIEDDWLSDHEIQTDYRAEFSLAATEAFARMVPDLIMWISQGLLVPGDMLRGFEAWSGEASSLSERFAKEAAKILQIERPGQICWFDLGPAADSRLRDYRGDERH